MTDISAIGPKELIRNQGCNVRFFNRYYVATIPKSRFEFLDSFFNFLVS